MIVMMGVNHVLDSVRLDALRMGYIWIDILGIKERCASIKVKGIYLESGNTMRFRSLSGGPVVMSTYMTS